MNIDMMPLGPKLFWKFNNEKEYTEIQLIQVRKDTLLGEDPDAKIILKAKDGRTCTCEPDVLAVREEEHGEARG